MHHRRIISALFVLLALVALTAAPLAAARTAAPPLAFEANRGQTDARVDFLARGPGYGIWLQAQGATFALQAPPTDGDGRPARQEAALRMALLGARTVNGIGEEPLPGASHYLSIDGGRPPVTDVPRYARVRYPRVYPGIDLVYYGRDGELEYDFVLAPGAAPASIALQLEGQRGARVDAAGRLRLDTVVGELVQQAPFAFQWIDGEQRRVEARFVLEGDRLGFAVGDYDRDLPLVIDPIFAYASYLGGSAEDRAHDVAVNAAGEAYVTGYTRSTNFPVVGAIQPNKGADNDAFLVKLSADGSTALISSYLGGVNSEEGSAIALDAGGNILIAGHMWTSEESYNLFELKLTPAGNQLVYTRAISGPTDADFVSDLAVDSSGNAYIVGTTSSGTFPLLNHLQAYTGGTKAFLRKLAANGDVLVSTYLGTTVNHVDARGVALDASGNVYVTGLTKNVQPAGQIYVLKLNGAISAVGYSKQFGGAGQDAGDGIAVLGNGTVYVAGSSDSTDFPVVGGYQGALIGSSDFVLLRLDATGALTASTYFGGEFSDYASAIALGPDGQVHVAGTRLRLYDNYDDVSVARFSANLATLTGYAQYGYQTGLAYHLGEGIAVDASGHAYVVSRSSGNLPTTTGAWRTGNPGDQNGHIAKINWDSHAALSINDRSRYEGHADSTALDFYLSLTPMSAAPVSVSYATANGSALAGQDYTAATDSVTIPAGTYGRYLTVSALGDHVMEADETFQVNLSGISGATLADGAGLATVLNDDQANGSLRFTASSASIGEAAGSIFVGVERVGGSWGEVTVAFATANGSAVAGSDYTATSGSLNWAHNETGVRELEVPISNDARDESNETFTVTLSAPAGGASLGTPSSLTVTIADDDPTPTLSVDNGGCSVAEGDSGALNCSFVLRLSAASSLPVTFSTATANGSATAGSDYTAHAATSRSIAAGQTTLSVNVPVLGDSLHEGNETFTLAITGVTNAAPATLTATGTIVDNDAAPSLSIDNGGCSLTEGDSGAANCSFVLRLSAASGRAVSFSTATANGTATAGSDYTAHAATSRNIAAGQTTLTVNVPVLGDTLHEGNETFTLAVTGVTNATPAALTATGTIVDNDAAPTLSVDNGGCSVAEGDSGAANCSFLLRLSAATSKTVTFSTAIANGTATAGSDYTSHAATSRSIAAGQTTLTVNVPALGDTLHEGNETFTLTVTGVTNASPAALTATGTIVDNDAAPSLSVDNGGCSVNEGHSGSANCGFVLRLSAPSGKAVSFNTATASGSATAGSDYTGHAATARSIAAGQTTLTVNVPVLGDTVQEGNETFALAITGVTDATPASLTATGTIIDDDTAGALPALSIADTSLTEPDTGSASASFSVSLSSAAAGTVTVQWATSNGSATAPADYIAASGQLSFAPGERTRSVSVSIIGDRLDESDETLQVTLSAPSGATLLRSQATGTIVDNDPAPAVSSDGCAVAEGHTGSTTCSLRFELDAVSGRPVTLDWQLDFATPPVLHSRLESPTVATSERVAAGAVVDGWRVRSGNVDLVRASWYPFDGEQSLDLNGDAPAIIDRDLSTTIGQRYRIALALATNPACSALTQRVDLYWGNTLAGTATVLPPPTSAALRLDRVTLAWQAIELDGSFQATSSSTMLSIGSLTEGGCGPLIDAVSVVRAGQAIPAIDTAPPSTGSVTIAPGQLQSAPIAVAIRGDRLMEGDEALAAVIIGGTGYASAGVAAITIMNDDVDSSARVFGNGFE